MANDERKKAVTQQLAALVEEALIAGVTLSPKPGLVNALGMGAHSDVDYTLFLKSAETLTPFFEGMAQIAWQHAIDQELREKIAEIRRKAEEAMLIATDGINTHEGAIWAMGLLTSVTARKVSMEQPLSLSKISDDVSELAALLDTKYRHKRNTHEHTVGQKYGVSGAYEEAALDYPHIRLAIQVARETDDDFDVQKQMHMLLVLMSSLDGTYVLHCSDQKTLVEIQKPAYAVSRNVLPSHPPMALLHSCQEDQTSPGGNADLLSASLFMLKIEEMWTISTYARSIPLSD